MVAVSFGKGNVTVWRPSVRLSILTVSNQGAACDAASVHFGPIIRCTDIILFFAVIP